MPTKTSEIRVVDSLEAVTREAAEEFSRIASASIERSGTCSVALAGGSTPKPLYELLASEKAAFHEKLPWSRMHFFWGDERQVPPDHSESNYRMVLETMLSKVPVPGQQVHRIKTEKALDAAAQEYEEILIRHFSLAEDRLPRLNLVLLGIGSDGHTASLFPGTDVLDEARRLVATTWVEKLKSFRVTLTVPVLNNAENVIFVVSGQDKAAALREVLQGEFRPHQFPSQFIRPRNGSLLWLVDRAAAQTLS